MANRPYIPIYPANWENRMAPLHGLREAELRLLDILLCKYFHITINIIFTSKFLVNYLSGILAKHLISNDTCADPDK